MENAILVLCTRFQAQQASTEQVVQAAISTLCYILEYSMRSDLGATSEILRFCLISIKRHPEDSHPKIKVIKLIVFNVAGTSVDTDDTIQIHSLDKSLSERLKVNAYARLSRRASRQCMHRRLQDRMETEEGSFPS